MIDSSERHVNPLRLKVLTAGIITKWWTWNLQSLRSSLQMSSGFICKKPAPD